MLETRADGGADGELTGKTASRSRETSGGGKAVRLRDVPMTRESNPRTKSSRSPVQEMKNEGSRSIRRFLRRRSSEPRHVQIPPVFGHLHHSGHALSDEDCCWKYPIENGIVTNWDDTVRPLASFLAVRLSAGPRCQASWSAWNPRHCKVFYANVRWHDHVPRVFFCSIPVVTIAPMGPSGPSAFMMRPQA